MRVLAGIGLGLARPAGNGPAPYFLLAPEKSLNGSSRMRGEGHAGPRRVSRPISRGCWLLVCNKCEAKRALERNRLQMSYSAVSGARDIRRGREDSRESLTGPESEG